MSRIEDELKKALAREEPSAQFAERVADRLLERIAAARNGTGPEPQGQITGRWRNWWRNLMGFLLLPGTKWALALSLIVVTVLLSGVYAVRREVEHERRNQRILAEMDETARGEKAKEQLILAMSITSAKLNIVQKKVQEISRR